MECLGKLVILWKEMSHSGDGRLEFRLRKRFEEQSKPFSLGHGRGDCDRGSRRWSLFGISRGHSIFTFLFLGLCCDGGRGRWGRGDRGEGGSTLQAKSLFKWNLRSWLRR